MTDAISLNRAFQWGGAAILVVALAVLFGFQTWPVGGVLLQRMVLLNPPAPADTRVEQVTANTSVAEGGSATLSARARGFVPSSGHVLLVYPDGRREEIAVRSSANEPDLFSVTMPGVQKSFRYRFYLHDGEGSEYEVRVEPEPAIQSLKQENARVSGNAPATGRIYWEEGQDLKLVLTASSPLEKATLNLESNGKKESFPMEIEGFGRKIAKVSIPAKKQTADRFFVQLVGENKLESTDNVLYSLERIPAPKKEGQVDAGKSPNSANPNMPGLRAKDLQALFHLQSEPVPDEYTAMVRQYLKNVAGDEKQP